MKVFRRIVLAITSLLFVVVVVYLFFYFIEDKQLFIRGKSLPFQESGNQEESTVFSSQLDLYVTDPDLGVVMGTSEKNNAAIELYDWHYKRHVLKDGSAKPLEETYVIFTIVDVGSGVVKARKTDSSELIALSLECLPEYTALFKSANVQFVSGNFDISRVIKPGDTLFTECFSNTCETVGPKCIIVRRPV